ncbi:RnfABCDGE type electron transport complex subunit G [Acetobacterium woodii]|uniref:Na(+)-translocating ferredoxin:NAD(+) oxidoreductase complex subunit G n=1 Tax=Acetobacterium woodii (strain ATCC 29683 / DSM 1030 / JCM 2381 / KCTC 1655 / WB1) TaxID=931626 RepID=RNFG_ACEWD|nr:RnfABCDGE type electron transport complex subunit G [Acetobacterium woodii]H6LC30.1 RecName: Full=Na(+)-translocating ferredoxin:NAD(+) oxidoreductase complex subunit G; AltName: Full=Rnf electron transport complex subunit G [Acetobacterium woodii DSM 1030]ACR23744.1 RnfG [Acetobacterium woodii DSM 1030]AFA48978.1 electron transport complex protein RnfG [Acetobacterium woodii DSM 1030]
METKEKVQIDWKVVFKLGLILFVISAVAACALALTNYVTAGTIEEMNVQTNTVARQEVLPKAADFEAVPAKDVEKIASEIGMEKPEELLEVYIGKSNGEVVGYTVKTGPTSGYAGEVQVLTGISADGVITGITIIKSNETPGLGAKASGVWNDQFTGKSAKEELVVVKGTTKEGSNEIQAITGSTITSKAVTSGVNMSIQVYQNLSK